MQKKLPQNNSATDQVVLVERSELDSLLASVRWAEQTSAEVSVGEGVSEELAALCEQPVLSAKEIDIERLTAMTADDIIDKFLRSDNYRIVVDDAASDEDIVTSAEIEDDEDMVSEELAEVYLAQGLKEQAKATYHKLSLLNPEKSIYFAELIAKIDSNN